MYHIGLLNITSELTSVNVQLDMAILTLSSSSAHTQFAIDLSLQLPFRNIWFEAATLVAVPPPVEISTGNVLKSALAGGLASALSTSMLHPIDTMKVQQHASVYLSVQTNLVSKVQLQQYSSILT